MPVKTTAIPWRETMKYLLGLVMLVASMSAQAASVGVCDGLDSIGNLIGNTKSFAQGGVKVAYVSTEEPAAHPDHVLLFVYGNEMQIDCYSINAGPEQSGFGSVDMSKLTSSYDSAKGLLLTLPANVWTGNDGEYKTEVLKIRVNRSSETPKITLE
jgi:hypothetical protein